MERKYLPLIVGLLILVLVLILGIAYMFMDNNSMNGNQVDIEGMKMFDFNSEFKMAVPEDAKFLKSWNITDDLLASSGYTYFDKDNEIQITYIQSPMVTSEYVDTMLDFQNSSGNCTIEFDGDLIITHNVKNNGKIGKSAEDSKFKYTVLLQKGHLLIGVSGNDLDLIKSMVKTVEITE